MNPVAIALPSELLAATFLARPNRFVVEARLDDGRTVMAHLPDPGRLRELLLPGRRLWLEHRPSPRRRTSWTALLVEDPTAGLVSLDTGLPNRLVGAALEVQALEELARWRLEGREVRRGRSRLDFRLAGSAGEHLWLEVKGVSLVEEGIALFPDAISARATRHLEELTRLAGEPGTSAGVLFLVQRDDARLLRPATRIDPAFAAALATAAAAGVGLWARRCQVSLEAVRLGEALPVDPAP